MNLLCVYVPESADENFAHGLKHGIWGFREPGETSRVKVGDGIILCRRFSGGSPRQDIEAWKQQRLGEIHFALLTEAPFESNTPEWPDEVRSGETKYRHRVRFASPMVEKRAVDNATIPAEVLQAIQRSACVAGRANFVADVSWPLFGSHVAQTSEVPPGSVDSGPEKGAVERVIARISSSGFHFDPLTIRAFHASLQTKPFVILAGNSGTGKSRLARLYAECFGATTSNRGFCMIPVRPDWNDGSELIGYTDLENRFRPGRLIEPLLLAHALPERPFFVCLDEMNLARVEHYFSDFLSIVESRRLREGSIETDPLIRHEQLRTMDVGPLPTEIHAWIARARETKLDLGLPPNLFVIGTVNMDETTHPFSRKVLDRANTLELNSVDLKDGLNGVSPSSEKGDLALRDVAPRFVRLADVVPAHRAEAEATIDGLEKLNAILAEAGLEVGYRVRDEATIFLIHGTEAGIPRSDATECIALQKVLPRVHGSSPRLDRVLRRLLAHFIGADSPDPDADGFIEALMRIRREHPSRAARKVAGMWLLFREDNFTSFWIA